MFCFLKLHLADTHQCTFLEKRCKRAGKRLLHIPIRESGVTRLGIDYCTPTYRNVPPSKPRLLYTHTHESTSPETSLLYTHIHELTSPQTIDYCTPTYTHLPPFNLNYCIPTYTHLPPPKPSLLYTPIHESTSPKLVYCTPTPTYTNLPPPNLRVCIIHPHIRIHLPPT